ncbi:hypothetical protein [Deinococcus hopiensis]|uniref:hypothetical protein n=1 Tax=Deinococcus hopiensis TaxID=309885 RepID=UPI000A03AE29|nr:hypothetical protein [Deinococcus hopiensis]
MFEFDVEGASKDQPSHPLASTWPGSPAAFQALRCRLADGWMPAINWRARRPFVEKAPPTSGPGGLSWTRRLKPSTRFSALLTT